MLYDECMTDRANIISLHRRLIEEQKRQIEIAASSDVLPSNDMIRYISDLESTIVAVEAMIEEGEAN